MIDMEYQGPQFTWRRGKTARTLVQERLNRVAATPMWMEMFPDFKISIISLSKSNHCHIILNTEGNKPRSISQIEKEENLRKLHGSRTMRYKI